LSSKQFERGQIVRIRRNRWVSDSGRLGMIVNRAYLAYDESDCKWSVLVDNKIVEYRAANLFPASSRVVLN